MSEKVSLIEWRKAKQHFKAKPPLKKGGLYHLAHRNKFRINKAYQLDHSFLNFNSKIFAVLPKVAGKGQFGVVKFAESESGSSYAVKALIDNDKDSIKLLDLHEDTIGHDAGLIIYSGNDVSNQVCNIKYNVMPNLGDTLGTYLQSNLNNKDVFDLAIKLCHQVSKHHLGLATSSGKKVCHRDLKPANIMVDPKTKNVRLTDYGISLYSEAGVAAMHFMGTPYYLPYINSLRDISKFTNRQLDVLSLKRCLYMPEKIYISNYGLVSVPISVPRILSKSLVDKYNLLPYLNTSGFKYKNHSALYLGALLILAYKKKRNLFAKLHKDVVLQKALHVIYFAKNLENYFLTVFESNSVKFKLGKLWPFIDKINSSFFKVAMENKNIYNLLIDVDQQEIPQKQKSINCLNKISFDELNSEQKINYFRLKINLKSIQNQQLPTVKFYKQNFFRSQPLINQVVKKVNKDELRELIILRLLHFSKQHQNELDIKSRYVSVKQASYLDPRVINDRIKIGRFFSTIICARSLLQIISAVSNRFKYSNSEVSLLFNKKLFECLKKIKLCYDSNKVSQDYHQGIDNVLSWLREVNNKSSPILHLGRGDF